MKSARGSGDKPLVDRWLCSPIRLHGDSFVRASEESVGTVVFDALGARGSAVSWADRSVGVPSCPAQPRPAAPPSAVPTRPARGMSGFWIRQVFANPFSCNTWNKNEFEEQVSIEPKIRTYHGQHEAGWRPAGARPGEARWGGIAAARCAQGENCSPCPSEYRRQPSLTTLRKHETTKSHVNRMVEHDGRVTSGSLAGPRPLFIPGC